jgi:hypothetical protein
MMSINFFFVITILNNPNLFSCQSIFLLRIHPDFLLSSFPYFGIVYNIKTKKSMGNIIPISFQILFSPIGFNGKMTQTPSSRPIKSKESRPEDLIFGNTLALEKLSGPTGWGRAVESPFLKDAILTLYGVVACPLARIKGSIGPVE